MSTTKGRKGTGKYVNTIAPKSAAQGMLVKQDESIDRINAIAAAVKACATSLKTAADIAAVNTAATTLETAMVALVALTKVDLK